LKLLNLGCGNRYHPDWINLDFSSRNEHIQSHNLYKPLPFDDSSIDVVYSSHVLEHFSKDFAPKFLSECYRVLKTNGIIRIVIPDLEQLMKNYIHFLDQAKKGNKDAQEKYEWTMIELFDQMVRYQSGGEMLEYWKQDPMPQQQFVFDRVGSEIKSALKTIKTNAGSNNIKKNTNNDALSVGKFRLSGEVHQWMYDEYSLSKLLKDTGFFLVNKTDANISKIQDFNHYLLDIEDDQSIRKPDSLFMEAVKQSPI